MAPGGPAAATMRPNTSGRWPHPGVQHLAGTAQPRPLLEQVAPPTLPLVVRRPGQRSRPARRRRRGQGTLAAGAPVVAAAQPAAHCQVLAGEPAQVLPDRPQHLLVRSAGTHARSDPSTGRRGGHEWSGKGAHVPGNTRRSRQFRASIADERGELQTQRPRAPHPSGLRGPAAPCGRIAAGSPVWAAGTSGDRIAGGDSEPEVGPGARRPEGKPPHRMRPRKGAIAFGGNAPVNSARASTIGGPCDDATPPRVVVSADRSPRAPHWRRRDLFPPPRTPGDRDRPPASSAPGRWQPVRRQRSAQLD
jgi:hypothetical protein